MREVHGREVTVGVIWNALITGGYWGAQFNLEILAPHIGLAKIGNTNPPSSLLKQRQFSLALKCK